MIPRKNVRAAFGDLVSYLAEPDQLPPGMLMVALNDGSMDVHRLLDEVQSDMGMVEEEIDIVGGQDLVPVPLAALRVIEVARRDLNTIITPVALVNGGSQAFLADLLAGDPYGAVLEQGNIRLIPMPALDMEDGLVVRYIPQHIDMTGPEDQPSFPGQLCELWVALSLERLSGKKGCEFANPKAVKEFINDARARAMTYLINGDGGQLGQSFPYYFTR